MSNKLRRLNERLVKILQEDIIEGPEDDLYLLMSGTYEGPKTIADIVVPELDEISEQELIYIFDNHYDLIPNDSSLFPSGWNSQKYGSYPAKLADSLSKSNNSENLTDVYNVYYANRDLSEEALEIFKNAAMQNPKESYQILDNLSNAGEEIVEEFFDAMSPEQNDLIAWCRELLKSKR